MKWLPASPWDYVTSTDRFGTVRFDPRKSFEWGAWWVSTIWGCILIYQGKFSEFFFVGYMAAWTTARFLRDREQRLNNPPKFNVAELRKEPADADPR